MIDLKKRTITERLIIANSLIAGAIADSDKMGDQFRDEMKKTDDVLLNRNEVIKAVDRHTRDDGTLDDDISCILEEVSPFEPSEPEYEPVTAEDFAKTMSENTLYSFMAWHGEALELMERQGFVICKKTM